MSTSAAVDSDFLAWKRFPKRFETKSQSLQVWLVKRSSLTQLSKCSPNKFKSPAVIAGHYCTKLASAEQNSGAFLTEHSSSLRSDAHLNSTRRLKTKSRQLMSENGNPE